MIDGNRPDVSRRWAVAADQSLRRLLRQLDAIAFRHRAVGTTLAPGGDWRAHTSTARSATNVGAHVRLSRTLT